MNQVEIYKPVLAPDNYDLPKHLTISAGQAISGLQMMEYERLAEFVDSNPKHFVYYPTMDAAVYTGPDAVIP